MKSNFSVWCGVLSIALGVVGLAGWLLNIPAMVYVLRGFPAMSPNTAIAITLCGLALILLNNAQQAHKVSRLAIACLLSVLVLQFLSFLEWGMSQNSIVSHFIAESISGVEGTVISSPYTSITLVLLSLSLLFLSFCQADSCVSRVHFLLLLALGILLVVLSGYLFAVHMFYRIDVRVGMALHTFVALLSITLGGFFFRSNAGVLRLLQGPYIGSRIIRKQLIPVTLSMGLFYVLSNWVAQYSSEYQAIAFLLMMLTVVYFMSLLANQVNSEEQEKDNARAEFDEFFDTAGDGLVLVDENWRIMRANSQVEQLTFYQSKELIGQSPEILIPEHLREKDIQLRSEVGGGGLPRMVAGGLRSRLLRKNGTEYPIVIGLRDVRLYNRKLYMVTLRDMHEQMGLEKELFRLGYEASHDDLTGLPDQQVVLDIARNECAVAQQNGYKVAFCICKLDQYTAAYENLNQGDAEQFLVEFANRMENRLRKQDFACQLDEGKFLILITDIERVEDAEGIANKIYEKVREPYTIADSEFSVGISIGMSICPDDGDSILELIEEADKRLNRVK